MPVDPIVDCHAHLADSAFQEDMDAVMKEAVQNGLVAVILVTESKANFARALQLRQSYPNWVNLCMGVHPVQQNVGSLMAGECSNRSVVWKDFEEARELITQHQDILCGVGEVGLDFTPRWCLRAEDREMQTQIFKEQCQMARDWSIPINAHSRSAGHYVIEALRETNVSQAHLHAFEGKTSYALQGCQYGYFFSIPPCVVRSDQKRNLVKALPLTNLLIETDSPVLGADKDIRNEPQFARLAVDAIAEIKQIDRVTVAQITTENAKKLYQKLTTLELA